MQKASEHPFDERSKTFYTQYFKNKKIRTGQQFEVFSRGRSIDVVTECTETDLATLEDTCFSHFQRVNSLELKGPHDPLTTPDLCLIISRVWGVAGKDKVERNEIKKDVDFLSKQTLQEIADYPSRRTVTIICVTRPDRILNAPELQEEYGFEATSEPGVYKSKKLLTPTWIIHPDELEVVPKNYPLLSLSRGKKLRQFVELCLENGWESHLYFIVDIALTSESSEIFEKIMEAFNMTVKLSPEALLKFDQFFSDRPEAAMQMPTLRELIKGASEVAVLKATRDAEKIGRLQGEQGTLIRQLRRKFTELPQSVITNVEQTDDTTQLEAWTDQILFANTWQEMFGESVSA